MLSKDIWSEALNNANWLSNRITEQRIDLQVQYALCHATKPDMSPVLPSVLPGYTFKYRSATVKVKKMLPRYLYVHIVDKRSENDLLSIIFYSTNSIHVWRGMNFTVAKDKNHLPSFFYIMDNISKQRQLEELHENNEEEAQIVQWTCY